MDKVTKVINKYLGIFNTTDGEYLNLVGDISREFLKLEGDTAKSLFGVLILGATTSNTDNYILYWNLTNAGTIRTLSIYKDSAKTQLVAEGSVDGDGWLTLTTQNASNIYGSARVVYTVDETSAANKMYVQIPSGFININDFNLGAISNPLEYFRRLGIYLVDQLYLNKASDEWLTLLGEKYFNLTRFQNETDASYSERIRRKIFDIKTSPLAIRDALETFGDNVQIIEGVDDGAFSEVSFANCYRDFNIVSQWVVKAALAGIEGGVPFFFRVIMENVLPENYTKIIDLVKDFKATGIGFEITII